MTSKNLPLLLLLALAATLIADRLAEATATKIKRQLSEQQQIISQLLQGYTKQEPPLTHDSTAVMLSMAVNSFYSISEGAMDYQVSFNLRQKWRDERLAYGMKKDMKVSDNLLYIKLGDKAWEKIWLPDTFFRNEKKANFHDITVDNRMLRLDRNGTLYYVTKISATFSCPMMLQSYPLDTQRCPITFESFGYTMEIMRFEWSDEIPVVDLGKNRQLPQFTLIGYTRDKCDQNYTAGHFPCLEVRFVLRRDIGFYFIQVYVPSILIVILSWVSFWINIESSPARVSIGLLTVLTTTTMSAAARATLPRVSYIKAIDVWMIICLIFVFASLIEYAVVNVISRRKQPAKAAPPPGSAAAMPSGPSADPSNSVAMQNRRGGRETTLCKCTDLKVKAASCAPTKFETDGKRKARNIDKMSRQCFPIAFILFNVVYWAVYAIPSESTGNELPIET